MRIALSFRRRIKQLIKRVVRSTNLRSSKTEAEEAILKSHLFDEQWYLTQYPDVTVAKQNALHHYLFYGAAEGRNPSALFSTQAYLASNPDVALSGMNPLEHFVLHGVNEGRLVKSSPAKTEAEEMILKSQLFDEQWYLTQYPDVTQDALHHYLFYGAAEGRNPSALFSTQAYLAINPDVAFSGINPLEHFVLHGFHEGRLAKSSPTPLLSDPSEMLDERITLQRYQAVKAAPFRVIVVIHAYYAEVFDELSAYLPNIPMPFSLCISTPTPEVAQYVRLSLNKQSIDANVTIKICPNRGRNFGPFLTEFSSQVLKHDLVLHLHTKKSLYTGSEQEAWRQHLYQTLIGNRFLVHSTLNSFAENEHLGVIKPAAPPTLPYWAYHWLSNSHLMFAMFKRLGVGTYQTQGMIDYPVGGMFWARVDAIRPLFTAGFTYEDFPLEDKQTDGTLAHAIERCVVELARWRHYSFDEINIVTGKLLHNTSDKNLYQYAANTQAGLYQKIMEADLVSFDIFDTLLMRPSLSPDAVFYTIGERLKQEYPAIQNFYSTRKAAETSARAAKNFVGDVDLVEIYACFPRTEVWSEAAVAAAQTLELTIEKKMLQPREAGIAALRYAFDHNKRVILMSDTYYPRAFIDNLVLTVQIAPYINAIYISSECQARKDTGELWQFVAKTEKIAPERWLHIGDNEHSDIQWASDHKIGYFHFMNPTTLIQQRGFQFSVARSWGTDLLFGPLVKHLGANPYLPEGAFRPIDLANAKEVGYVVFGPLMCAFVAWIAKHPTTKLLRHIYFLSREGYGLRQFYEAMRSYDAMHMMPTSSYLLTSRRIVLSAIQGKEFQPEDIEGTMVYDGTLRSFLNSRLGLKLPPYYDIEDIPVNLPEDSANVMRILKLLKSEIVRHGKEELAHYYEYLKAEELVSKWPSGVVDIGYSGTIQKGLQNILDQGLVGFYLATFHGDSTHLGIEGAQQHGGYAFGYLLDMGEQWKSSVPLVKYSLLVEAFLTAPHGQFESIGANDSALQPLFKPDPRSPETLAILSDMQAGALAYCHEVMQTFGASILECDFDKLAVQEPLRLLGEKGIRIPNEVAQALNLEDDFSGVGLHSVGKLLAAF